MTPAVVGWIVLGALCTGALILVLLGVVAAVRAQRQLKNGVKRVEATQRRAFDQQRLNATVTCLTRDAASAKDLLERARRALSTISVAVRYLVVTVRIVKHLT